MTHLTRRHLLLSTAALLATPLALSGCGRTDRFRYKLVVEVDTPSGLKTGFAVREIVESSGDNMARVATAKARGEAVAVDIAPGQTLFALVTGADGDADYSVNVTRMAWPDVHLPELRAKTQLVALWPNAPPRKWAKTAPAYPMLVHFRDIRDPKSVERVDPAHLNTAFGKGVTLKRITVQITDEPVTTGIEKRLEWLGQYPEPSLNPNHGPTDYSISATLHHGDFRQGVN